MSGERMVRAAMTETVNAYRDMPSSLDALDDLRERLDAVRAANVDHHIALMDCAKDQGARIICFGELFTAPYFALETNPMWLALAEDAQAGPTISAVRAAARRLELVTIALIFERDPSGRRFNTAVVVDERGEVLGKYRKTHIPHGKNERGSFNEGFYYDRSDGQNGRGPANVSRNEYFPVFTTSVGRVGVAICYDRHFEGVMHSLAHEGAELVFCPAVTFGSKSERLWALEFPVDAARHRLFIGGSNRKGVEPPWTQPYFGQTHFVGPNGLAPNISRHPNLVIADLNLGELTANDPSGWNLPRDIRPAIYSPRT